MNDSQTRHLFDSDGAVLIFGGPYSNLQATRAIRDVATRQGIPPERCICTGDIVAYCADPVETVQEIQDWGCAVIAGNCEKQLAEGADDCGCGFDEGSTCDLLSVGWYRHANTRMSDALRHWMGVLPDAASFTHQGKTALVTHGGITHISRFLWSLSPAAEFSEELAALAQLWPELSAPKWIFAGHSGIPFTRQLGETAWVNAGVIGMPPHDGAAQTRYAILKEQEVTFHKLDYDAQSARNAMQDQGLTQGYHAALTTGIWPSEDILPDGLKRS